MIGTAPQDPELKMLREALNEEVYHLSDHSDKIEGNTINGRKRNFPLTFHLMNWFLLRYCQSSGHIPSIPGLL